MGLGAVAGAALLLALRRRVSINSLVGMASLAFAAVTFAAGRLETLWMLCAVLFAGGVAWISILASLNICAQTTSPAWVRARALSMYLLVLQGGLAAGGAMWGAIAGRIGLAHAMAWAAGGVLLGVRART